MCFFSSPKIPPPPPPPAMPDMNVMAQKPKKKKLKKTAARKTVGNPLQIARTTGPNMGGTTGDVTPPKTY